ncbi:MAG: lysylphosphatidylglycerol synthase transmembrane domain-containing protein [Rikenellaceae bacterium]
MQKQSSLQIQHWKIVLPVIIGLGFIAYMFFTEVDTSVFSNFNLTIEALCYLLLAFGFMVLRDLGYIIRLRLFSQGFLSWKQAFRVIMLWEFTSAITPSTIGGTSVAVVFVHKEGLSVGKSTSMVMLTAFFDELFFSVMFPLIIWIVGFDRLFAFEGASALMYVIIAGYLVKLGLTILLSVGLFWHPRGMKWMLIKIFSLPFLRKWRKAAAKTGTDIVVSSKEIRTYPMSFWLKSLGATTLTWCSRFLVANAIFMAFFALSDHLLVFARQLSMWVPMIISPTPGGSGFAEYIFSNFLGDVITVSAATMAGTVAMIAILWRCVTYYPYLIVGMFIIPRWFARSFGEGKK